PGQDNLDLIVSCYVDLLDGLKHGTQHRSVIIAYPFQTELDVGRRERRAVTKGKIISEFEHITRAIVLDLPGFGQIRLDAAAVISDAYEISVHVIQNPDVTIEGCENGVESLRPFSTTDD